MPLFGKQTKPFIDHARGDAQAAELRKSAAALDWAAVESALRSTGDRTRREFLVDAVALGSTDLKWVDRWVQERPDEPLARLLWGACGVHYAWHVRSGAEPKYVSSDQMKGFHEWLGHAEDQLQHAIVLDPNDSAPWIALLWSAVGLGLPLEEATSRWENVSRLNPQTELGALGYTTFVSARWNGSHDLMWDFIRKRLANEPDGSPQWVLVPDGHFEQWVADRMAGDADVHASRYFQQPDVQKDINDAYQKYLGSPARRPSPLEPQNREMFACAFYLMGARDLLHKELEQIGPGIQTLPWGYLGAPLAAYQGVRESVGLK
ncbi:MAG: hypothetical protein E6I15_11210 [Chloroflexi bacterium]|nr:MAG: hypothetical protein E6I15_11210 [Chloroflexota bacterium]